MKKSIEIEVHSSPLPLRWNAIGIVIAGIILAIITLICVIQIFFHIFGNNPTHDTGAEKELIVFTSIFGFLAAAFLVVGGWLLKLTSKVTDEELANSGRLSSTVTFSNGNSKTKISSALPLYKWIGRALFTIGLVMMSAGVCALVFTSNRPTIANVAYFFGIGAFLASLGMFFTWLRHRIVRAGNNLVLEKNILPMASEPLPPWVKYPNCDFFDPLERFGARLTPGAEYRDNQWVPYWHSLTINQRHAYFKHYDLGDHWSERSKWFNSWVLWELHLDMEDEYLKTLINEATLDTRESEPMPPWCKYPDLCDATWDWRDGKGRDYLFQVFQPFFDGLSYSEKEDYVRRHDLGLGWIDSDEWLHLIGYER